MKAATRLQSLNCMSCDACTLFPSRTPDFLARLGRGDQRLGQPSLRWSCRVSSLVLLPSSEEPLLHHLAQGSGPHFQQDRRVKTSLWGMEKVMPFIGEPTWLPEKVGSASRDRE